MTVEPDPFDQLVHGPERARFGYHVAKRSFDIIVSLVLLPVLILTALTLLALNPFFSRGPLFFRQARMGQHCRSFEAWKFRSMTEAIEMQRGAFDALETDRITGLGRILRQSRLDELPQIINVIRGEMSLIGPRPDYHPHAMTYLGTIPGYRERHIVLPGISGLAQVQVGYAEGIEGFRRKVAADLHYVRHASLWLDLWIAWRTLAVVLGRRGS